MKQLNTLLVAVALVAPTAGCVGYEETDLIDFSSSVTADEFVAADVQGPPPAPRGRVVIPAGPFCVGSTQDILRPVAGALTRRASHPRLDVDFEKCDGSPFASSKDCHVRVGGYESFAVVRTSFVWPSGSSLETASWNAWPSAQAFAAAPCGEQKTFHLTCNDGGIVAHWVQEGELTVEKFCPP